MFYANDEQKQLFGIALERAKQHWGNGIVTELTILDDFYPAEEYHQDYFNKNPGAGYCSIVIEPKISKARSAFKQWFKKETA